MLKKMFDSLRYEEKSNHILLLLKNFHNTEENKIADGGLVHQPHHPLPGGAAAAAEEVDRRQQMKEMLAAPLPHITHFLASVLATVQDQLKVITVKCYSSWMTLGAISLDTVRGCDVGTLSSPNSFPSPPPARGCQ